MLWQFGELGYDYSINYCVNGTENPNCRLDPKPIRWDYFEQTNRRRLYDVYKALIDLKTNYETFQTTDYQLDVNSYYKHIYLNHPEMSAVVLGNFDVEQGDLNTFFQNQGWWYEYFSGDSLLVDDLTTILPIEAGEYRLFTNKKIATPDIATSISAIEDITNIHLHINPNPVTDIARIEYQLSETKTVKISVINTLGQHMGILLNKQQMAGKHYMNWQTKRLSSGIYFVEIEVDGQRQVRKVAVNH